MSKARNIADLGSNDVLDTDGTGATVSGHLTVSDSTPDFVIQDTDGTNQLMKMQQVGGASMIKFRSDTNDGELYFTGEVTGNNKMKIATNGDITMYKDDGSSTGVFFDASSGSVGIGQSSPDAELHIGDGGGASDNTRLRLTGGTSGQSTIQFGDTASANIGQIQYDHSNNDLVFRVNAGTRATLDSSGNLLLGTTSSPATLISATSGGGIALDPDSYSAWNREAASSTQAHLIFNQTGVDAQYLQFRKDGSEVGSIGSRSGSTGESYISLNQNSTGAGLVGGGSGQSILPSNKSGTPIDNSTELGNSGFRFKDLYLSGGVYLGGTGSANKLDDYEEGTWTPTLGPVYEALSSVTALTSSSGTYTKIGNKVFIKGVFVTNDTTTITSDAGIRITGVPFTAEDVGSENSPTAGAGALRGSLTSSNMSYFNAVATGSTLWFTFKSSSGTGGQADDKFSFFLTYETTA